MDILDQMDTPSFEDERKEPTSVEHYLRTRVPMSHHHAEMKTRYTTPKMVRDLQTGPLAACGDPFRASGLVGPNPTLPFL
jgi:hypothetical protein